LAEFHAPDLAGNGLRQFMHFKAPHALEGGKPPAQMLEDRQTERGPVNQTGEPPDNIQQNAITAETIAPIVESTVAMVGDLALQKIMASGKMEELAKLATAAQA
jgi:hypothetical protein